MTCLRAPDVKLRLPHPQQHLWYKYFSVPFEMTGQYYEGLNHFKHNF